jgi:biotin operon repressor
MVLNQKCEQIKLFAKLVEKQQTGNAHLLAKKINISRSKLYELIEEFNDLGIDIKYSKNKSSFYYNNDLRLRVRIPIEVISETDCKRVFGGYALYIKRIIEVYSNIKTF